MKIKNALILFPQNADNPDEIEIDDDDEDDEDDDDDAEDEVEQVPVGLEKQTVPAEVFGGLKTVEEEEEEEDD
jgi:hypothetical protein